MSGDDLEARLLEADARRLAAEEQSAEMHAELMITREHLAAVVEDHRLHIERLEAEHESRLEIFKATTLAEGTMLQSRVHQLEMAAKQGKQEHMARAELSTLRTGFDLLLTGDMAAARDHFAARASELSDQIVQLKSASSHRTCADDYNEKQKYLQGEFDRLEVARDLICIAVKRK